MSANGLKLRLDALLRPSSLCVHSVFPSCTEMPISAFCSSSVIKRVESEPFECGTTEWKRVLRQVAPALAPYADTAHDDPVRRRYRAVGAARGSGNDGWKAGEPCRRRGGLDKMSPIDVLHDLSPVDLTAAHDPFAVPDAFA